MFCDLRGAACGEAMDNPLLAMAELHQTLAEIPPPRRSLLCLPSDEAGMCLIGSRFLDGEKGFRGYRSEVCQGSFIWISRAEDLARNWKNAFDEMFVDCLRLYRFGDIDVLGRFGRNLRFGRWGKRR